MAIQGLRGAVEAAIQRASNATGVSFTFLMKTANRESGYNPRAKASTSSAAGLFQFVEQPGFPPSSSMAPSTAMPATPT